MTWSGRWRTRDAALCRRHTVRRGGVLMRPGANRVTILMATRAAAAGCLALLLAAGELHAQTPQIAAESTASKPQKDTLGRSTPRGTVLGFLGAARRNENDLARQYLNTRLTGEA